MPAIADQQRRRAFWPSAVTGRARYRRAPALRSSRRRQLPSVYGATLLCCGDGPASMTRAHRRRPSLTSSFLITQLSLRELSVVPAMVISRSSHQAQLTRDATMTHRAQPVDPGDLYLSARGRCWARGTVTAARAPAARAGGLRWCRERARLDFEALFQYPRPGIRAGTCRVSEPGLPLPDDVTVLVQHQPGVGEEVGGAAAQVDAPRRVVATARRAGGANQECSITPHLGRRSRRAAVRGRCDVLRAPRFACASMRASLRRVYAPTPCWAGSAACAQVRPRCLRADLHAGGPRGVAHQLDHRCRRPGYLRSVREMGHDPRLPDGARSGRSRAPFEAAGGSSSSSWRASYASRRRAWSAGRWRRCSSARPPRRRRTRSHRDRRAQLAVSSVSPELTSKRSGATWISELAIAVVLPRRVSMRVLPAKL